jgi:hypothetical protein
MGSILIEKWGAYWSKNGEHLNVEKWGASFFSASFLFMDMVGLFSDVHSRYPLGANPRGVKEY